MTLLQESSSVPEMTLKLVKADSLIWVQLTPYWSLPSWLRLESNMLDSLECHLRDKRSTPKPEFRWHLVGVYLLDSNWSQTYWTLTERHLRDKRSTPKPEFRWYLIGVFLIWPLEESSIGSLDDTSLESTHLTPPWVLTCMTIIGSHPGQMLNPPEEYRGNHIRVYHLHSYRSQAYFDPTEFRWHRIQGYPLHCYRSLA